MKRFYVLMAATLLLSIGCGASHSPMTKSARMSADAAPEAMVVAGAHDAEAKAPAANDAKPRKIIYNANAVLVVDDFDTASKELKDLVKRQGAMIAKDDINTSPNSRRSGSWTIRVPVDHFDAFMDEVAKIGELHQRTLDSRDITDEYYDLEARIKNKVARQEALREMLKKRTDKVEDLLAVDRELAKVTEDIEVAKGQLQRWTKQTDFATVVLKMQDRRDYVPPPPTSPTFSTTLSRSWNDSVDGLSSFLKGLVIVVVFLVPWLPVIAVVVLPFYLIIRKAARSLSQPTPPAPPAPPLTVLPATPPPAPTA
jgi:hypothetical protein